MPDPLINDRQFEQDLALLQERALGFVAPNRIAELMKGWATRELAQSLSEDAFIDRMDQAAALADDLAVSLPSLQGTTALDRLQRSLPKPWPPAMEALRKARHRLLRAEAAGTTTLRDLASGETLRLLGEAPPALPAGCALFARVAALGDGRHAMAGIVTPLGDETVAFALGHPGLKAGQTRWVEAVYAHALRHGMPEIPGLNGSRHAEARDFLAQLQKTQDPLHGLAQRWARAETAPDPELIGESRRTSHVLGILQALSQADHAEVAGAAELLRGYERLLLVQMEALDHRIRAGSGGADLDAIALMVAEHIADARLLPGARDRFASLRRRLPAATRRPENAALERLVQRIQGLRAKTVEQGCTESEALAAAEKVAELLDRHGLSLGELEFNAQPCEGIGIQTNRRRATPLDECMPDIAAFFDCRSWVEQPPGQPLRHVIFGLRGDVAAAQYLFELVERAFATETDAFRAGPIYADMAGDRRSASNSFQIGLGSGIRSKLHAIRAARSAAMQRGTGRDLVPQKDSMIEAAMERLGLALRFKSKARKRVLSDAYEAGTEAGERFEYTPGLTTTA